MLFRVRLRFLCSSFVAYLVRSCVRSRCVLSGGVFVRSCFLFVFLPGVIDKQGGAVCVVFLTGGFFVLCRISRPVVFLFSLTGAGAVFIHRHDFKQTGGVRLAIRPGLSGESTRGDYCCYCFVLC